MNNDLMHGPHITGHERTQPCFCRLDLTAACFAGVGSKVTGRPGYAPKGHLETSSTAYLNRVRSSRRLETESEVIWLLRHLKPDFKTTADFRRDIRNAFRPIFRPFVLLCRQRFRRDKWRLRLHTVCLIFTMRALERRRIRTERRRQLA